MSLVQNETHSCQVLVVETRPQRLHPLVTALHAEGMPVTKCENVAGALEALRQRTFAVAVLGVPQISTCEARQLCDEIGRRGQATQLLVWSDADFEVAALGILRQKASACLEASTDLTILVQQVHHASRAYLQYKLTGLETALTALATTLEKREDSLRRLISNTSQAIAVYDDTSSLFVNQVYAELFGYETAAELLAAENLLQLLAAPHEHTRLAHYTRALLHEEQTLERYEYEGVRQDGSPMWVENKVCKISWQGKAAIYVIASDITERKRLEAYVHQSHKANVVNTMIGGMAHEFNKFLSLIIGYTDLAQLEVAPESQIGGYLQQAGIAGFYAKNLVRSLMTLSHPHPPERAPVAFSQTVQEALQLFQVSLPDTVELRQQLDMQAGMVLASATQILQVVINLCSNAAYAMQATGGVLDVSTEAIDLPALSPTPGVDLPSGSYVRLTVRDTGPGIAPQSLERIFEPFFSTKTAAGGCGMGLTIVQHIVSNHGGAITVTSTPGRGTIFTIYLPQMPRDVKTREPLQSTRWPWTERPQLWEHRPSSGTACSMHA